jgi:phosphoribosylamine--glycine ligase
MDVLVLGSGGRELALVWALRRSPSVGRLLCTPGNPGIARIAEIAGPPLEDQESLVRFAAETGVDLVVVGPEQPLAEGLADRLSGRGIAVFGPSRRAAELEWSKAFAKAFMRRHGIPTARHTTFGPGQWGEARSLLASTDLPVVLKADGLAAGKGVVICRRRTDAFAAYDAMERTFGAAGATVVVEEFLEGEEASIFAITDGENFVTLAPAQDHKRALDGDRGKNTGGMGAYAPAPIVTAALLEVVRESIIVPTLRGMAAEERPFRGCLYVGIMITPSGPRVIEYNCRFGDPETQVVLPLYDGDLAALLLAAARGGIGPDFERAPRGSAVCIVLASEGYPDAYEKGREIRGIEEAEQQGAMVFHAGTRRSGDRLVTAGGRVLGVTAASPAAGIPESIDAAYRAVEAIHFDGMHFRRDIGKRALGL